LPGSPQTPITKVMLSSYCHWRKVLVVISKIVVCVYCFCTNAVILANYNRQFLNRVKPVFLSWLSKLCHPQLKRTKIFLNHFMQRSVSFFCFLATKFTAP